MTQRYYTSEQQADLDIKTSVNKIGEIVNQSQQLNSVFWDKFNRGETIEENFTLYCDICKLAILSNIEIDRAKREFVISSTKELQLLKNKYQAELGKTRPKFCKRITEGNGYKVSSTMKYKYFYTPMDYVQQVLNNYSKNRQMRKSKVQQKFLNFADMIRFPNIKPESLQKHPIYYDKRDRIIDIIRETRLTIQRLYIGYKEKSVSEKEYIKKQADAETLACIEYIEKIIESEAVMYLLLRSISSQESQDVSRFVFRVLFGRPNTKFFTMIKESKEPIGKLIEDKFGNIQLYDFTYFKEYI